jgi:hypothetical protein
LDVKIKNGGSDASVFVLTVGPRQVETGRRRRKTPEDIVTVDLASRTFVSGGAAA